MPLFIESLVLVDPRASRVSLQSLVVLLLVESKEIACIEDKLSDHIMMMCLLV